MAVEVEKLIVTLEAQLGNYNRQLAQGQAETNKRLGQIEQRFNQSARTVRSSAISMGAALGSIGAYLSVDQLLGYANAWTRINRSLEAGEQTFNITLTSAAELTRLANEARIDTEAFTKTYIRTAAAIRDYGYSSETAAQVTSTLAKALKLGSASASEQASTILQFSQALQKGKLDGDEFRTVMENAGVVQELLAKRLKVTKGEIVKMAADGKLKLLDLVGAMTDGADQIDRIFRAMPQTVDEAFTVLNNSITQFIGKMDKTYGISESLANAMKFLADNIDTVGKAALVAGVGLLAMFAPVILAGIAALGASILATVGTLGLVTGGLGAVTAAFSLFGDGAKLANDGVVSLSDAVGAFAEELATTLGILSDVENKLAGFAGKGFQEIHLKPIAERVRENALQRALGRGFAESTTVTRVQTPNKLAPPAADAEVEKRRKAFEKDLLNQENRIELAKLESEYIGRSTFEVEKMRTRQELLNEARKAGIELTDADRIKIEALAEGTARAVSEAETLRNAYEDIRQSSKEFLSGFITDMKNGVSGTEALANALNRISDKLIDMAVNDLVEGALGALTGRGGSTPNSAGSAALMGLFGFANGGIAANGRPVPLPRFAKGGVSRTASIFGEAGPEAAVPLPDGRSIPVTIKAPKIPTAHAGGAGRNEVITVSLQTDAGLIADIAQKEVQTAAGPIVKVAVEQSTRTVKQAMPGLMTEAQRRKL